MTRRKFQLAKQFSPHSKISDINWKWKSNGKCQLNWQNWIQIRETTGAQIKDWHRVNSENIPWFEIQLLKCSHIGIGNILLSQSLTHSFTWTLMRHCHRRFHHTDTFYALTETQKPAYMYATTTTTTPMGKKLQTAPNHFSVLLLFFHLCLKWIPCLRCGWILLSVAIINSSSTWGSWIVSQAKKK